MALITIRRRVRRQPVGAPASHPTVWPFLLFAVPAVASAVAARLVWLRLGGGLPPAVALGALFAPGPLAMGPIVSLAAPMALFLALRFARVTDPRVSVAFWTLGAPWLLLTLTWIAPLPGLAIVWLVPIPWVWFGWWPLGSRRPAPLHRARWASRRDLRAVLVRSSRRSAERPAGLPPAEALILGTLGNDWVNVRTQPTHRELGGVLERVGHGLQTVSQLAKLQAQVAGQRPYLVHSTAYGAYVLVGPAP